MPTHRVGSELEAWGVLVVPVVKLAVIKGRRGRRGPLSMEGQTPAHGGLQPHWPDAPSLLAVTQLPCQAFCPPAQGFASIVTN